MASATRSHSSRASNDQNFIVAFYTPSSNSSPGFRQQDRQGRTLDDILAFSDRELEYHHDFIQYLFPLPERSPINPDAPLITQEVRSAFLSHPELRSELRRALSRLLNFYGFELDPELVGAGRSSIAKLQPESRFRSAASQTWLLRFGHNHLRITRILRCLRILGLEEDAREFLRVLRESDDVGAVGPRTWAFWERAFERPLYLAPDDAEDAAGVAWLRE